MANNEAGARIGGLAGRENKLKEKLGERASNKKTRKGERTPGASHPDIHPATQ